MSDRNDEKQRYRYLIEFPSKLRVFVDNDQLLSEIVQKYALTSPRDSKVYGKSNIEAEEQSPVLECSTVDLCPECGSADLFKDTLDDGKTCMSCGLHFDNGKSQKMPINLIQKPKGYKINEEREHYKVICRSKSGTKYTVAVNKKIVENIYKYMALGGRKLTAPQIMVSFKLPMATVRSTLKILVFQGRARFEHLDGKRKLFYEAVQKSQI